jgi:hypothetical protein
MLVVLHTGDPAEGERALRPLVEWGDPVVTMVQPMPYTAVQAILDEGNPWGIHDYFKVDYLRELPDEAIDAACEQAAGINSPNTVLVFSPLGGAMDRIDRSTMALEMPDAGWNYFCLAMWTDPALAEREIAWSREWAESCARGAWARRRPTSSTTATTRGCGRPSARRSSGVSWI